MDNFTKDLILDRLIQLMMLFHFLPLFFLLIVKNKTKAPNNIYRALVLLCLLSVLTDIICYFAAPIFKNNNPIMNVYGILVGAIMLHIYKLIFTNEKTKKIIQLLLFVFVSFSVFLFIYKEGYRYALIESDISLKIIVIPLSIYYLITLFGEMKIRRLKNHYFFWINAAFLFYYSTTFYIFLFEEFVTFNPVIIYYIWPIHLIASIIFDLLLSKGIWTMKKLS